MDKGQNAVGDERLNEHSQLELMDLLPSEPDGGEMKGKNLMSLKEGTQMVAVFCLNRQH